MIAVYNFFLRFNFYYFLLNFSLVRNNFSCVCISWSFTEFITFIYTLLLSFTFTLLLLVLPFSCGESDDFGSRCECVCVCVCVSELYRCEFCVRYENTKRIRCQKWPQSNSSSACNKCLRQEFRAINKAERCLWMGGALKPRILSYALSTSPTSMHAYWKNIILCIYYFIHTKVATKLHVP